MHYGRVVAHGNKLTFPDGYCRRIGVLPVHGLNVAVEQNKISFHKV
jgi:hypothetical protein